jgi:hypothetical protein
MTLLLTLEDKEYKATVPVHFRYFECADAESVHNTLRDYKTHAMHNLRYSEPYDFDLIVTASPYLVNGEKKSNLHHLVDCYYQERPVLSYYQQRLTNHKIIEEDIENSAILAAHLGIDAVMKHYYSDKPFIVRERPISISSEKGKPLSVKIMRQREEAIENMGLEHRRITKKEDLILRTPALKGRPIRSDIKEEFLHYFPNAEAFIMLYIGTPHPF